MRCPHCKEELGEGDEYDLMKSHLWYCKSKTAFNVIKAIEEETDGCPWESD